MMSAPSAASRTAWLRPWPRAAPVIRATLPATRPGRGRGPVVLTGLRPASLAGSPAVAVAPAGDGQGHAGALPARPRAPSAGRHAVAGPERARASAGRGTPRAAGGRSRRDGGRRRCGSLPVQTSSQVDPAVRRPAHQRPGARGGPRPAAAGCWRRPGRRSGTAGCRRSGPGSTRATSRPAPASHSATPTPTGRPPGRGRRPDPSGRSRRSPAPAAAAASTTGTVPSAGTDHGRAAGHRWPAPRSIPVGPGGVEVGRRDLDARSRPPPPSRAHSAASQSARSASRSRPGPDGSRQQRAAGPIATARPPGPGGPGGPAPGRTRARPTPAPTTSTSARRDRVVGAPSTGVDVDRLVTRSGARPRS